MHTDTCWQQWRKCQHQHLSRNTHRLGFASYQVDGGRKAVEPPPEQQGTVVGRATPTGTPGGGAGTSQVQLYQRLRLLGVLQVIGVIAGGPALLSWLRVPAEHRARGSWQDAAPAALAACVCTLLCADGAHFFQNAAWRRAASRRAVLRCARLVIGGTSLALATSHVWGLLASCTLLSWGIAVVTLAALPGLSEF